MRIVALVMLVHGSAKMPGDLELVTEKFDEDWSFVRSGDAHWLGQEIRARGGHFIRITEMTLRSGLGTTPQEAIAGTLRLALNHISERFNTVQIKHFEVSQYRNLFLARVKIYPYQIQQNETLSVSDETVVH
ncbi:hypothetical protein FTW19_08170 [Terriglobus albidus]|uniref:Uncharacterized protein n=1 Tax=Terriglobus albidus TaxID=1592106 RepID=A0A5B9E6V6_9BACT|nr:hypothetical protein [Terriglobus albidus]QEE27973.1 hypothetical protein FTW19_08170 [Terriglobus albidus]